MNESARLLPMSILRPTLRQFTKSRSEYAQLMDDVFKFADGDTSFESSIGNKMRRMVEAFSTFCYRKSIENVVHDRNILSRLEMYSDYFENRMYRCFRQLRTDASGHEKLAKGLG